MRLVDKDALIKAVNDGSVSTSEDIEGMPEEKAIPIEWLRKESVELMYDGEKVTDKDRYILNKLIDRWEKENV